MRVLFFARARDLACVAETEIETAASLTVAEVRRRLAAKFPRLGGLLEKCHVAVDEEFVENDQAIAADAEVAVLPPVSGG
jgi:molybdopterin synthase catalytic subunit